jgi:hypothetical protein
VYESNLIHSRIISNLRVLIDNKTVITSSYDKKIISSEIGNPNKTGDVYKSKYSLSTFVLSMDEKYIFIGEHKEHDLGNDNQEKKDD